MILCCILPKDETQDQRDNMCLCWVDMFNTCWDGSTTWWTCHLGAFRTNTDSILWKLIRRRNFNSKKLEILVEAFFNNSYVEYTRFVVPVPWFFQSVFNSKIGKLPNKIRVCGDFQLSKLKKTNAQTLVTPANFQSWMSGSRRVRVWLGEKTQ